jgi:hypothetical protein
MCGEDINITRNNGTLYIYFKAVALFAFTFRTVSMDIFENDRRTVL